MADVRADHWMPLYVADYLKDTTHLSTMEHGAYFLLLLHAWTHDGLLPLEERRIARIAGLSAREWRASGDTLLAFFHVAESGYRHARVDKELVRAGNMIEQRRAAGKASAAARSAQRESQRNGNGRSTDVATNGQRNSRPLPTQEEEKVPLDKESNGASINSDKAFWDGAKAYLGKSKASLIGQWVRDYGKEATAEAITAAQLDRAVNPVEFIQGRFRRRATSGYGSGHSGVPL